QFLSIIRLPDGSSLTDPKGRVTSHLIGIFSRTMNMLREGIRPVYIWDGEPPKLKQKTIEARKERKEFALKELRKAISKEDKIKWAQQTSKLTAPMIKDAEKLLQAMGVPSIRAPSEGEAEISYLVKKGILDACASQDWDALLFGAPKLIRNISISGKRKIPGKRAYTELKPAIVDLKENLKALELTQEQLIIIALLIGTDYNPGVKGYGPKKSYKLVKDEQKLSKILAVSGWEFEVPAEEIIDLFLNPKVKDAEVSWENPDSEKILKFLVDDFSFSQERVESQLKGLEDMKKKRTQTDLDNFF
ncbi:MAG TPA: flap endonuclease-1, partial [Candidatus Woesearchaeota archaeon]|nr:flap endonuclease-1 [Candidatus Woesearchaeota archaeon]